MPNFDATQFPPWVLELETPLWITGLDGTLKCWNEHAVKLIGSLTDEALGLPCHEFIRATYSNHTKFCEQFCQIRRQARSRSGFGPYRVRVKDGAQHWHDIHIVVFASHPIDRSESQLCHLALDTGQSAILTEYLNCIATRSHGIRGNGKRLETPKLSRREEELLQLLATDKSLKEAAFDLSISYHTVRNHLKSLRRKFQVHSTEEVIALYLISGLSASTPPKSTPEMTQVPSVSPCYHGNPCTRY